MEVRLDDSKRELLANQLFELAKMGEPLCRKMVQWLARSSHVSTRTIERFWEVARKRCHAAPPRRKTGRKTLTFCEQHRAEELVEKQIKAGGWKQGERAIWDALEGALSLREVRSILKHLKGKRKARIRAYGKALRFSFSAFSQGVMWALDEGQLAPRKKKKDEVFVQVMRDPATRETLVTELSPPVTAEGAIAWVTTLIEVHGYAPLVIFTDNGPAYKSDAFRKFLMEHRIVHMRNLPHTPQHNCHAEKAVGEAKGVLGIPKGKLRTLIEGLPERIVAMVDYLNSVLKRGVLDGRTACQAMAELHVAEDSVCREKFFQETCAAMREAVQDFMGTREARLAERKAIYETLVRFQLISITRGGKDDAMLNAAKTR